MPPQANVAPSFIKSKIALSPSRLITVTLVRSITSVRPSSELPALLHVFRNSSTHGWTRVPSTTRRRSLGLSLVGVSIVEILNMLPSATEHVHDPCQSPARL